MPSNLSARRIKSAKPASEHAKALSSLGASKGGLARSASLTDEQKSEIASKAAKARWGEKLPEVTHGDPGHPLKIGDIEIPCYVLSDGTRVLHQRGMVDALGMARGSSGGTGGDRLAKFVAGDRLKDYVSQDLLSVTASPKKFKVPGGHQAYGYEATVLSDICEAVLAARKAGKLQSQQMHIADQCEMLLRGFARVGIIALVDEATGFQYDRRTLRGRENCGASTVGLSRRTRFWNILIHHIQDRSVYVHSPLLATCRCRGRIHISLPIQEFLCFPIQTRFILLKLHAIRL